MAPRLPKSEKKAPLVWINVEAQMNGPGSDWMNCQITDTPVVEDVGEERATKLRDLFKKEFPVGRYVQILDLDSKSRRWVYEGWIRIPAASRKKKHKKVPPKLAEFTEKLQEISAQVREEKAQMVAEKGVSSKPPSHVLAKRKRRKKVTK